MEHVPATDHPDTTDIDQKQPPEEAQSGWRYSKDTNDAAGLDEPIPKVGALEAVEWSAPEYQHHKKDAMWYGIAAVSSVLVTALVYLITRDTFSAVVVVIVALLFFVNAARKPQMQTCRMNTSGITIGDKPKSFSQYKAFTVDAESNTMLSFTLLPLKRFTPFLTVSFPHDKYEDVVSILQEVLPFEPDLSDPLDNIAKRLRF